MKFLSTWYKVHSPVEDDAPGGGGSEEVDRGDFLPEDQPAEPKEPETEQEEQPVADEESEETPEEAAEREAAEAAEEKKKRIRIPKARFDEAMNKARAREQALIHEIEQLKQGQRAAMTTKQLSDMQDKLIELQDQYEDLILDGEKDKARAVRRQIAALQDDIIEQRTAEKMIAARQSALESVNFTSYLDKLEAQYPQLDANRAEYDQEKTDELAALMEAFVKAGDPKLQALQKAVKYVMRDAAPQQTPERAQVAREVEARKKAAAVNRQQPPATTAVGKDSHTLGEATLGMDVKHLSQKQFAKLDEDTLARLRGDEV